MSLLATGLAIFLLVANSALHDDSLFQIHQWSTTYQAFLLHCHKIIDTTLKLCYRHFNHTIQFVFKNAVGFFDFTQWKTMCDEGSGVDLSLFNKAKYFRAIATIHATGFEGKVLAIHFRKRKNLWPIIKSYHRYYSIGTSTLPRQAKGVIGSGYFEYSVGSTVIAMLQDEIFAFFGSGE